MSAEAVDEGAVHPDDLRAAIGDLLPALHRIYLHAGDSDNPEAIATLLVDLRNLHKLTGQIVDQASNALLGCMPYQVAVPGAVFERHRPKQGRRKWENSRLLAALRPALVFDEDGAEVSGADALKRVQRIWNLAGYNARDKALAATLAQLGHTMGEFCEEDDPTTDSWELKVISTEDGAW